MEKKTEMTRSEIQAVIAASLFQIPTHPNHVRRTVRALFRLAAKTVRAHGGQPADLALLFMNSVKDEMQSSPNVAQPKPQADA